MGNRTYFQFHPLLLILYDPGPPLDPPWGPKSSERRAFLGLILFLLPQTHLSSGTVNRGTQLLGHFPFGEYHLSPLLRAS